MHYCYGMKIIRICFLYEISYVRDENFIKKMISSIIMIMNHTVKTNTTYTRLFLVTIHFLIIVTISWTFSFCVVLSYKVHEQHHREDYQKTNLLFQDYTKRNIKNDQKITKTNKQKQKKMKSDIDRANPMKKKWHFITTFKNRRD